VAIPELLAPVRSQVDELDADARMRKLVAEHYDFVWRVLRRLGISASGAEDAAQDVFIVVDRKTREIWPDNEKSYLFAVAMRVAGERRRAERTQPEHLSTEAWSAVQDTTPGPDVTLDDRRAREVVDEILELIPFDQRLVFVLFELEDMTTREIATALDLPSGTVASRLRLARRGFQQAVHRYQTRASARGA
jgi:RNA polymerase sigma-70 factor, ECF subfamily